jgi:hypothetical protein
VRGFTAVDLTPQCESRNALRYEYDLLEKIEGASELIGQFSAEIWRNPEAFALSLPQTSGRMTVCWCAAAPTSGVAVLRDERQAFSISLLASGLDPNADKLILEAYNQHVVHELEDTPFEPAFDLIDLQPRPLLATIGLFLPEGEADRRVFALADRCFAAAYFRRLGLA